MESKNVDVWISELSDLPPESHKWIAQIAYELADGVTKGFWMTLIATDAMSGWIPHIGLREYVENRESQTVFDNVSVSYDRGTYGLIIESLVLAGFCERTRLSSGNKAWLTPKAFELLKCPHHLETEHDQKTTV